MEYPTFMQASQNILQENMINIRFVADTNFSFPVLARRGGILCDAMFCYTAPSEGRSLTAPRPYGWMLISCESGEVVLSAACEVLDFADTAEYPPDTKVEMRLPHPLAAQEHARSYQLLYEEYEKLRAFAFAESPTEPQRLVMQGYRKLFEALAYIGHYPFYHALSPEFFRWLGLELAPPSAQAEPEPQHAGRLASGDIIDALLLLAEEFRGHVDEAARNLTECLRQEDKVTPQELRAFGKELTGFSAELRERFAADSYREKQIDRLHAEIQEYKNGLLNEVMLALERDIIKLIDDSRKSVEVYRAKNCNKENYRKLFTLLEGFGQDLTDLLYRHGVEPYEVPGERVDMQRQRILSTVPTGDEMLDKTVAIRYAPGWEKSSGIVQQERIGVYVYAPEEEREEV